MRKMIFVLAAISCQFIYGQVPRADLRDSAEIAKGKEYYKYIGIQSNLLLQQFISFNSNASLNTNPYVFSFARNNINTGAGFVVGTGFQVSEKSSNDGVSSINVQDANVTLRYGYEKKFMQKQKFIPLWGVEFAAGVVYNKSVSRLVQSTTNTEVIVESEKAFAGPAFRGGLNYAINKYILLGTEFYFNCMISTSRVNNGNGNGFGTRSFAPFNVGFQAPTALYLIFRY